MSVDQQFWRLADGTRVKTPEELHQLLQVSRHIVNVIYEPGELCPMGDPTRSQIRDTKFERVSFSKTRVSGFTFQNCIFDQCLFIGTTITDCEFHNCQFTCTNTHKISVSGTYIDPASFSECLSKDKHQNIGVHLYQALLSNSRGTEQVEFERDAHFLFLRWKRFQDAYEIRKWLTVDRRDRFSKKFLLKCMTYLRRLLWEELCGSGLRIRYFIRTVAGTIAAFATINYLCREEFGLMLGTKTISSVREAVYYTIISFTTLGYGDIVPTTLTGQMFASVQSFTGFCLLALLVSMLFRRMSR